jgi:Fe-S cluster assembly protein SufD
VNATVRSDALEPYVAAFDAARPFAGETEAARTLAFERFAELGFPSPRDESWKYTNLRRLESRRFSSTAPDTGAMLRAATVPELAPHRVVLLDGRCVASRGPGMPPLSGVRIRTLAEAIADGEPQSALFRVPSGGGTERFAALNVALCPDVLVVDIDEGARLAEALQIDLASSGTERGMSHPRLLIRAAAGSSARIVLRHAGGEDAEHFVNAFVEVEAGPDAELRLYRLQAQGGRGFLVERLEATLGQRALLEIHDAQLGASLTRLDLNARLAAPGSTARLTGLFLADGSRHMDTHVHVDHLAPHTTSLVDYRGIAAGRGRGVFNGKAIVHAGAQKSQARQVSRNLLLTAGAEIDSKPELEIYADDVQCSHGSTTGQLDPAALFYLRSRGLGQHEARGALTRAFAGAVLSRMDHGPFAAAVHATLDDRLVRLLETTE